MENKGPFYPFQWPVPDTFDIVLVLGIFFSALVIYIIYKYLESREHTRIHNYQHFLFMAKNKGLNNFQFKILKNMASNLKLSNPKELVLNPSLFESTLTDFIEYLKKQTEGEENIAAIFRDITAIYEKLYIAGSHRKPLETMNDIGDGEILFFTVEDGDYYLGKVTGRGSSFLVLKLFTPVKKLNFFEEEKPLSLHIMRINDAEYLVKTSTAGIEDNALKVKFSDDIIREREFRHPYINVVVPAVISIPSQDGLTEPEQIECSILKLNEYECVLRTTTRLEYGREYPLNFEISKYKFNIDSKIVSSKTVETENVYYFTFKFLNITDPGKVILSRYIAESV